MNFIWLCCHYDKHSCEHYSARAGDTKQAATSDFLLSIHFYPPATRLVDSFWSITLYGVSLFAAGCVVLFGGNRKMHMNVHTYKRRQKECYQMPGIIPHSSGTRPVFNWPKSLCWCNLFSHLILKTILRLMGLLEERDNVTAE